MVLSDLQLDDLPILVFEEMIEGINVLKKDVTGGTPTDDTGGIVGDNRIKAIRCVHLVRSSEKQVYTVRHLHCTPHYSIPPNTLSAFILSLDKLGLRYRVYEHNRSYIGGAYFLNVWNSGTDEFAPIHGFVDDLCLPKLYSSLNKKGHYVKKRNNFQVSCGFTQLNYEEPNSLIDVHEFKPSETKATKQYVDKFVCMSELSKELKLSIACTGSTDLSYCRRQKEFAKQIHPNNCYEGLTVGLYSTAGQLLQMHCDDNNATQPIFDLQIVASQIFVSPKTNEISRSFCAAYG
jgi:hypothetical protein